ncbi:Os09g0483700, partial [Oryza sativa Japonica Group]
RTTGGWQRADGRGRAAGAGSGRRGRNCHWRRVVQVQHGLRRLRHGGAARVVDVGGREHDGRRARLAPLHGARPRLHGSTSAATAAAPFPASTSVANAAAPA